MKINEMELQFLDQAGSLVLRRKLIAMPLKESGIIARSIEHFNDPEPCMIHRSAVMKTIYLELFEYFDGLARHGIFRQQWECIPCDLQRLMDISADVTYVAFESV